MLNSDNFTIPFIKKTKNFRCRPLRPIRSKLASKKMRKSSNLSKKKSSSYKKIR